jgi:hypothetical protein
MHRPGYVQGGQEAKRGYLLLGVYHRRIPGFTVLLQKNSNVSVINHVWIALKKPQRAAFLRTWPSVVAPTLPPHTRQRSLCHPVEF